MKIVLDVPDVHGETGKDMFDFVGELCDTYDIAAVMSILPEPPKEKLPPTKLKFSVVFRGEVEIGKAEEGGWVHDKNSLHNTLESMVERTVGHGGITNDSCSELLSHSVYVDVTPL